MGFRLTYRTNCSIPPFRVQRDSGQRQWPNGPAADSDATRISDWTAPPKPYPCNSRGPRPPRAPRLAPSPTASEGHPMASPFSGSGYGLASRRGRRLAAPGAGAVPRDNCIVTAKACPGGTADSSPTLQRWVAALSPNKSRRDGRDARLGSTVPSGRACPLAAQTNAEAFVITHISKPFPSDTLLQHSARDLPQRSAGPGPNADGVFHTSPGQRPGKGRPG